MSASEKANVRRTSADFGDVLQTPAGPPDVTSGGAPNLGWRSPLEHRIKPLCTCKASCASIASVEEFTTLLGGKVACLYVPCRFGEIETKVFSPSPCIVLILIVCKQNNTRKIDDASTKTQHQQDRRTAQGGQGQEGHHHSRQIQGF